MQLYQCHKQVEAAVIEEVNPINCRLKVDGEWTGFGPVWWNKHEGTLKGGAYFVRYEDGYVSVSPKEAFEKGYSQVGEDGELIPFETDSPGETPEDQDEGAGE